MAVIALTTPLVTFYWLLVCVYGGLELVKMFQPFGNGHTEQ